MFLSFSRSLIAFLQEKLREKEYDINLLSVWSVIESIRPYLGHSVTEWIIDGNQKKYEGEYTGKYLEIVNGSSVLPEQLFSELVKFPQNMFKYKFNAHVTEFKSRDKKVEISYRKHSNVKNIVGDYAIVTTTTRELNLIKFTPDLSQKKKDAIGALEYMGSVKIFLKFKEPFWAKKNKIPIIRYDENQLPEDGGAAALSDDILKAVSKIVISLLIILLCPDLLSK